MKGKSDHRRVLVDLFLFGMGSALVALIWIAVVMFASRLGMF